MTSDYRFDAERLPAGVRERLQEQLDALQLSSPAFRESAAQVLAASRFVSRWAARLPAEFRGLVESDFPSAIRPDEQQSLDDVADFDGALRRVRNRVMVCLAARQALGLDSPEQTVADVSALAETLLERCVDHHWQKLVGEATSTPVRPMIFALGKLGGHELNFSSDIDLIAAHTQGGEIAGRAVEDIMAKLVRRVTRSLADVQAEGFAYRVDWRLRPFGSQGAPSASLAALDSYFELHAREWERYAWQKARCVAGDIDAGEEWLDSVRPFIYRRYIDFGQVAGLRAMKDEIDRDVRMRGREQDIKRGWGGIREMEFAIQAQQLVHGGARPSLQQRGLGDSVAALLAEDIVDADFASRWMGDYWFLRGVENCWQAVDDAQTHVLPVDEEPRQRLLVALRYDEWSQFEDELQQVRTRVRAHFLDLFTPEEDEDLPPPARALSEQLLREEPEWPAPFLSLEEPLAQLWRAARRRIADESERRRTLDLTVRLVDACPDDKTAERILAVMEAVCGRGHYVTLLREHRDARRELVELCGRSSEIARELAVQPALLAELCEPELLYAPPSRARLREHLDRQLSACDPNDFEEQLNQLRRIRQSIALRIAAADVLHVLPLMRVSDHLTELAEEIVRGALHVATEQMRQRDPALGELAFAVVAYGKLGGMELSYSSDLDLVFVYRDEPVPGTDLAPQVFFTRLAQKLINALATQTSAGRCYEVDMRLRPNGNSGLLVTSTRAFESYQREQAWTWEHQALVRSRAVAGSPDVIDDFNQLRRNILQLPRDNGALQKDILDMRRKMREQLAPKDGSFHAKQSPGGLVDIEFFSQWLVLSGAHAAPNLARFPDVLRILEVATAVGAVDAELAGQLGERYRELRACVHAKALGSGEEAAPEVGSPAALTTFFDH